MIPEGFEPLTPQLGFGRCMRADVWVVKCENNKQNSLHIENFSYFCKNINLWRELKVGLVPFLPNNKW